MPEVGKIPEIPAMDQNRAENFQKIKPEQHHSLPEIQKSIKDIFNENIEREKKYYTDYTDRLKLTPAEESPDGTWAGVRGESKYIPSGETDRGNTVKGALALKSLDGVKYENAEPDFSKCAEAIVEIKNMTDIRAQNFAQADESCAKLWNSQCKDGKSDWSARDVKNWRKENQCSWHECCDTKTMQLVPQNIHDFFRHSGGVAECKARDGIRTGGEFDA